MTFWRNVGTGFSYGLGGGFGWGLGNALARWLLRAIKLIFVAVLASSLGMCALNDLAKTSKSTNTPPHTAPAKAIANQHKWEK